MIRTLATLLLGLAAGLAIADIGREPEVLPHAGALRLVLDQRLSEIGRADQADGWWFDTKKRTFTVQRPFGPGVIDSTHFFAVNYEIDGKPAGSWSVNTRTGQVAGPGQSISPD